MWVAGQVAATRADIAAALYRSSSELAQIVSRPRNTVVPRDPVQGATLGSQFVGEGFPRLPPVLCHARPDAVDRARLALRGAYVSGIARRSACARARRRSRSRLAFHLSYLAVNIGATSQHHWRWREGGSDMFVISMLMMLRDGARRPEEGTIDTRRRASIPRASEGSSRGVEWWPR
jgi:hypothetical protein